MQVVAGPEPAPESTTSTTAPLEFVAGQPISYRIDFHVPPGWQTLLRRGDHVVLATRPLTDADMALALLARNDTRSPPSRRMEWWSSSATTL